MGINGTKYLITQIIMFDDMDPTIKFHCTRLQMELIMANLNVGRG